MTDDWRTHAACAGADPELFFPTRGEDATIAQAVCADCPVRHECLAYSLEMNEHHGIWGGISERGRRRIKRARYGSRPPRACHVCGTVFQPRSNGHRACSEACATVQQRARQKAWEVARG